MKTGINDCSTNELDMRILVLQEAMTIGPADALEMETSPDKMRKIIEYLKKHIQEAEEIASLLE